MKITKVSAKKTVTVEYADASGKAQSATFDKLIVAIGRVPNTSGLDAEAVGLQLDERGFVAADAECRTNLPNVWAIGDVVRGPMLAHKAEEDGVVAVERMTGQKSHIDYNLVPGVVYTWPEVAGVGKTEEQLKEAGVDYRVGKFPFTANSRARSGGDTDGVVTREEFSSARGAFFDRLDANADDAVRALHATPLRDDDATHQSIVSLPGMQERTLLVGGQFEVESTPQVGTTIRACLPLKFAPPTVVQPGGRRVVAIGFPLESP